MARGIEARSFCFDYYLGLPLCQKAQANPSLAPLPLPLLEIGRRRRQVALLPLFPRREAPLARRPASCSLVAGNPVSF